MQWHPAAWLEPAPEQGLRKEPPLLCLLNLCFTSTQLQWQTATKTPHSFCLKHNWTFQVGLTQMKRLNSSSQITFGGISCIVICKYLKTINAGVILRQWNIHLSPPEGGTNHFPTPPLQTSVFNSKIVVSLLPQHPAGSSCQPACLCYPWWSFQSFVSCSSMCNFTFACVKVHFCFFFRLPSRPIHIGLFC